MSIARKEAIIAMTPGADHSEKEGYFVKLSAGKPIACTAASDVPFGIILHGEDTDGVDSIGVSGGLASTAHVKLSGDVAQGADLQLHTDGSCVTDALSAARVIVAKALEAGSSGDLIEAVILTPVQYS
jgi:hypothetical protein